MAQRLPDPRLQQALAHLQRGRLEEAASALEAVLALSPEDPDALQLMGMLLRRRGDPAAAEHHLRRSLRVAPQQPHVHNNLGNLLLERGDVAAAAESYAHAVALAPTYVDAWRNLGLAELRRGRAVEAARAFEQAIELAPNDAGAWVGAGDVAMRRALPSVAVDCYARAVELAPVRASAWHKLGLAHRDAGEYARAFDAIVRARELDASVPEVHYSHGNVALDLGRVDESERSYREAIRLRPDYREAHAALNKLLRQYRAGAGYLESYAAGVRAAPGATPLHVDWAEKLLLSARGAEALQVVHRAVATGLDGPALRHVRAKALADQGRSDESATEFRRAIDADPASAAARIDYARLLLCTGGRAEARVQLEKVLERDPFDQVALAYLGACLEPDEDPAVEAWFDYDALVRCYPLPAAPGYSTPELWHAALARVLERLHDAVDAPAEQTLRGGTQTLGDLFSRRVPELEALEALIEPAIDDYVAFLASVPAGPLAARRGSDWRYSGSWSVRLRSGGHHVNHVHAEGWISSVYYVTVPRVVAGSNAREGWLKFGESNLGRGAAERVRRYVEPRPGLLVLFPSYFFHGTVPFAADEYRTTVAFDVVPTRRGRSPGAGTAHP